MSPTISLESATIAADTKKPELLDATFIITSFELKTALTYETTALLTKLTALVAVLILLSLLCLANPHLLDQPPGPTEVDSIPLNMVDMGTHEVVELLEQLTDKYAIRAQNVPNVQLNFKMKKDDGLTIEEAILVIESLLNSTELPSPA